MSAKGNYQIPFDSDGNQKGYPESWGGLEWRDNDPFDDTLTYSGYGRGRSSATLHFKRSDGKGVEFFMSDFHDIVKIMRDGKVSGRFKFVKKGQNYGCQRIGDVDIDAPADYAALHMTPEQALADAKGAE